MRCVTFAAGKVVVAQRDPPRPASEELLVRVDAAGLNGADILQCAGHYPAPPGAPADIAGLEFSGTVVDTGSAVTRFAVGKRVMGIVGGGGQAELVTIHERAAMPVPDGIGPIDSGGFPEVFTTAYDALFEQARFRPGERVLINGAAGGVGTAAVQLVATCGGSAVASVRNPDARGAVAQLGAVVLGPEEIVDHGPYDVVIELVGGPNLREDLNLVSVGGRIVVVGVGGGIKSEINLLRLMNSRARISGSTLRARPLEDKCLLARKVERQVLPLLAGKRLKVPIEQVFPLDDAESAYERFSTGGKVGKIILDLVS